NLLLPPWWQKYRDRPLRGAGETGNSGGGRYVRHEKPPVLPIQRGLCPALGAGVYAARLSGGRLHSGGRGTAGAFLRGLFHHPGHSVGHLFPLLQPALAVAARKPGLSVASTARASFPVEPLLVAAAEQSA